MQKLKQISFILVIVIATNWIGLGQSTVRKINKFEHVVAVNDDLKIDTAKIVIPESLPVQLVINGRSVDIFESVQTDAIFRDLKTDSITISEMQSFIEFKNKEWNAIFKQSGELYQRNLKIVEERESNAQKAAESANKVAKSKVDKLIKQSEDLSRLERTVKRKTAWIKSLGFLVVATTLFALR